MPEQILRAQHGFEFLEKAITPFHILAHLPERPILSRAEIDEVDAIRNRLLVEYDVPQQERILGAIAYEIETAEGFRIVRCTVTVRQGGHQYVETRLSFSNFKESNGIFFPHHIVEEDLSAEGDILATDSITIQEISLNQELGTDDFVFKPSPGSVVHDLRTGATHRLPVMEVQRE